MDEKVKVYLLHQLTIELLEELKEARCLIFVDASSTDEDWSLRRISLRGIKPLSGFDFHTLYPEEVVYLLKHLYNKLPEAWILSIKGEDFSFGSGLSPKTRRLAMETERLLESLIKVKIKDA